MAPGGDSGQGGFDIPPGGGTGRGSAARPHQGAVRPVGQEYLRLEVVGFTASGRLFIVIVARSRRRHAALDGVSWSPAMANGHHRQALTSATSQRQPSQQFDRADPRAAGGPRGRRDGVGKRGCHAGQPPRRLVVTPSGGARQHRQEPFRTVVPSYPPGARGRC